MTIGRLFFYLIASIVAACFSGSILTSKKGFLFGLIGAFSGFMFFEGCLLIMIRYNSVINRLISIKLW